MAYDYNALYRKEKDALGAPTPDIMAVFKDVSSGRRILDIGCGQGRDAVPLARAGHHVVAVDLAPEGVADVQRVAEQEGLPIEPIVADVCHYMPEGRFDDILVDRTLHMLDPAPRVAVLKRLLGAVEEAGRVILADEPRNMADFVAVFEADDRPWALDRIKPGLLLAVATS